MKHPNKSHLTAISRKVVSLPTRQLLHQKKLRGQVLDYGCGRGQDADRLGFTKYDPHFYPEVPTGQYDTIICNYVLNVIPDVEERRAVVKHIRELLAPGGFAYISVRNDSFQEGYTSKGTWQGHVGVPGGVMIKVDPGFRMYAIAKLEDA